MGWWVIYCTYSRRGKQAGISRSPQEVERSRKKSQGAERSRKESQAQLQEVASSCKQPQAAARSRKQPQVASSRSSHGGGQGRCQRRPQSESCLSTAALLPLASTGRQRWRTRQRACAAWVSTWASGRAKRKVCKKGVVARRNRSPLTQRGVHVIGCHTERNNLCAVAGESFLTWPPTTAHFEDVRAGGFAFRILD